jgi:hypothetical protein
VGGWARAAQLLSRDLVHAIGRAHDAAPLQIRSNPWEAVRPVLRHLVPGIDDGEVRGACPEYYLPLARVWTPVGICRLNLLRIRCAAPACRCARASRRPPTRARTVSRAWVRLRVCATSRASF